MRDIQISNRVQSFSQIKYIWVVAVTRLDYHKGLNDDFLSLTKTKSKDALPAAWSVTTIWFALNKHTMNGDADDELISLRFEPL